MNRKQSVKNKWYEWCKCSLWMKNEENEKKNENAINIHRITWRSSACVDSWLRHTEKKFKRKKMTKMKTDIACRNNTNIVRWALAVLYERNCAKFWRTQKTKKNLSKKIRRKKVKLIWFGFNKSFFFLCLSRNNSFAHITQKKNFVRCWCFHVQWLLETTANDIEWRRFFFSLVDYLVIFSFIWFGFSLFCFYFFGWLMYSLRYLLFIGTYILRWIHDWFWCFQHFHFFPSRCSLRQK